MKSGIIFESHGYTVCWLARGLLTVERNHIGTARGKRGVALTGNDAGEWRDHIVNAFDDAERVDLVRAVYRQCV